MRQDFKRATARSTGARAADSVEVPAWGRGGVSSPMRHLPRAGEIHSSGPTGSVTTCTFTPCRRCLWDAARHAVLHSLDIDETSEVLHRLEPSPNRSSTLSCPRSRNTRRQGDRVVPMPGVKLIAWARGPETAGPGGPASLLRERRGRFSLPRTGVTAYRPACRGERLLRDGAQCPRICVSRFAPIWFGRSPRCRRSRCRIWCGRDRVRLRGCGLGRRGGRG